VGVRLARAGSRPADRPDERLKKQALVMTSVTISVAALAWGAMYLWLGRPIAAAVPLSYTVLSAVGLVYFARSGNFGPYRLSQITAMLVLPFLLQWAVGGFVNSGAVMVWAFTGPLAALVLYSPRQAVIFFAGFLVLTIISGLIDPVLAASAAPMPSELRLLFFVLDLGAVAAVVYAVLQFFVAQREQAQLETDRLLHNILPVPVADRLIGGESRIADDYAGVTVVFADVAGFTPLARDLTATQVIDLLDGLFSAWDGLADRFGLEKIKTIGDAYMAVAGAPVARADHVRAAADMALAMLTETANVAKELNRALEVRVGMHTGPAMAGVIGKRKFFYDIWGDAVNVASRMETSGQPGRIHVSAAVEAALRGEYLFEERGTIDVKGLGEMRTYFLLGQRR
jgi:guanylate cyclase